MAIDAICCEDGHVQERALFDHLLALVEADDVWMGGRVRATAWPRFVPRRKTVIWASRSPSSSPLKVGRANA
jgi:hypothetical protein